MCICLPAKVDGTPEAALEQINSKQYAIAYQPEHRKVVKIGVNFDSATRSVGGVEDRVNSLLCYLYMMNKRKLKLKRL